MSSPTTLMWHPNVEIATETRIVVHIVPNDLPLVRLTSAEIVAWKAITLVTRIALPEANYAITVQRWDILLLFATRSVVTVVVSHRENNHSLHLFVR